MGVIDGALRKLGQEICGVCRSAIKEGLQGGSSREVAPSCGFRRNHFWVYFGWFYPEFCEYCGIFGRRSSLCGSRIMRFNVITMEISDFNNENMYCVLFLGMTSEG